MRYRNTTLLAVFLALWSLAFHAPRVACGAEESSEHPAVPEDEYRMNTVVMAQYFHTHSVATCKERLAWWMKGAACERLAAAECLLETMIPAPSEYDWMSEDKDYERKPGTDDLSLPAGRVKWALEQLLNVKLPGVVDKSLSEEQIESLHAQATLVVEAYRQGLIAAAAHHDISPAHFARLKRQFKGKVDPEAMDEQQAIMALDRLFWEWPPIGRKYEDLVSIIGVKGENQDYGVDYTFRGDMSGAWYRLVLKNGVIWSVQKRWLD